MINMYETKKIKNHMQRKSRLMLLVSIPFVIGSFLGYGNSTKEYQEIKNTVYKGWKAEEGKTRLFFEPLESSIPGNLKELDLEMGEEYNLLVRIPRLFQKEIVGAFPVQK